MDSSLWSLPTKLPSRTSWDGEVSSASLRSLTWVRYKPKQIPLILVSGGEQEHLYLLLSIALPTASRKFWQRVWSNVPTTETKDKDSLGFSSSDLHVLLPAGSRL